MGVEMKRTLAILFLLATPKVCPATVLVSEYPTALEIAEPLLLLAGSFVTVYNGRHIQKPSLLWSCLGMAVGTVTIAFSTSEVLPVGVTAAFGTASFILGFARLPRPVVSDTRSRTTSFEVGWRMARLVMRF